MFIVLIKNVNNMKKVLFLSMAIASQFMVNAQTARVQVIHNSADLAADSVDVYLGGTILLNNFAFRTATPFIDAPANVPITLGVAPKTSSSVLDTIYSVTVTLDSTKKYILVANGLISPTGYTPSRSVVPFRLSVYDMALERSAITGKTDVLVAHGATDAPTVDVRTGTTVLVNDISFGNFCSTGYLSLTPADYTIDVTNSTGTTIVKRYSAPLLTLGLADSAITVVASGFLDSTVNSNGKKFGLWAALSTGRGLIPLPEVGIPTSIADAKNSNSVMVYPNPATDAIFFSSENTIASVVVTDVTGRVIAEQNNVKNGRIEMSNFGAGLYIVKTVGLDGEVNTVKVVKK